MYHRKDLMKSSQIASLSFLNGADSSDDKESLGRAISNDKESNWKQNYGLPKSH